MESLRQSGEVESRERHGAALPGGDTMAQQSLRVGLIGAGAKRMLAIAAREAG